MICNVRRFGVPFLTILGNICSKNKTDKAVLSSSLMLTLDLFHVHLGEKNTVIDTHLKKYCHLSEF